MSAAYVGDCANRLFAILGAQLGLQSEGKYKYALCAIVALGILAILTAGGAAALLAVSGGPNIQTLFVPGCILSGISASSLVLDVLCVIDAKRCEARWNEPAAQNCNNEAPSHANISHAAAFPMRSYKPNENATLEDMPAEVLVMILKNLNNRQRHAIARMSKLTAYLVKSVDKDSRQAILPEYREDILHSLSKYDVFAIIDDMNSWKSKEKRGGGKYIQLAYNHEANQKELATQLIEYVEYYALVPFFWAILKECKMSKNGKLIWPDNATAIFIDYFPDAESVNQYQYPNKYHLKKVINPEYMSDMITIIACRCKGNDAVEQIVDRMNKKIDNKSPLVLPHQLFLTEKARVFLEEVEKKGLIPLLLQILRDEMSFCSISCESWFDPTFPKALLCIDNPDYRGT